MLVSPNPQLFQIFHLSAALSHVSTACTMHAFIRHLLVHIRDVTHHVTLWRHRRRRDDNLSPTGDFWWRESATAAGFKRLPFKFGVLGRSEKKLPSGARLLHLKSTRLKYVVVKLLCSIRIHTTQEKDGCENELSKSFIGRKTYMTSNINDNRRREAGTNKRYKLLESRFTKATRAIC